MERDRDAAEKIVQRNEALVLTARYVSWRFLPVKHIY